MLAVYFGAVVHRTSFGIAGVEALHRFGVEATGLSVLAVAQVAMYAAMQIPAGHLLDKFGPMRVMIAGSLLMAVGQVIMSVSFDYGWAIVARLFIGLGDAPIFLSVTRLVAAWFPPRRVPFLVQIAGVTGQTGQLASAIPVAWALHGLGWSPAFGVLAVLGLATALAAGMGVRMPTPAEAEAAGVPPRMRSSLKAAVAVPGTRLGFWSHFATPFSANALAMLWGVPFFITGQGLTAAQASLLLTVLTLASMVASPVTGLLTGRHPLRRSWLVLGSAVTVLVAWIVLLSFDTPRPLWQLVIFMAVIGAGGPVSLVGIDFARSWNPPSRLGVATGLVNVGGFASTIAAILVIGIVLQAVSEPGTTAYSLDHYRMAFAALLLVWIPGVIGVVRSRRLTRVDLASQGVVVPRMRDAVKRFRRDI